MYPFGLANAPLGYWARASKSYFASDQGSGPVTKAVDKRSSILGRGCRKGKAVRRTLGLFRLVVMATSGCFQKDEYYKKSKSGQLAALRIA